MGFLANLFGGAQAKAATKAAGIQQAGAAESRGQAEQYQTNSLADLEKALQGALGQYNAGEATATGALQPYADAGGSALKTLMSALGLGNAADSQTALDTLRNSPDYQFRYNQGQTALDRQLNAGGRSYGGTAIKAAQEYGQGFASSEIGKLLDRLTGVSNQGQSAASGISNIASNFAGDRAQALLGTGQAQTGVRQNAMQSIIDAINAGTAAKAGGVINAQNAKSAGAANILSLLGGVGKFALGGGFGGGVSAPSYAGLV